MEKKPASCTTTSLFYCNPFKELFLYLALLNRNCFVTAFVLKSGCKGMTFSRTIQMFSKKNALKHAVFRLFDKKLGIWRSFTFYYLCVRVYALALQKTVLRLMCGRLSPCGIAAVRKVYPLRYHLCAIPPVLIAKDFLFFSKKVSQVSLAAVFAA